MHELVAVGSLRRDSQYPCAHESIGRFEIGFELSAFAMGVVTLPWKYSLVPDPGEHHDGSETGENNHNGLRNRPHKLCITDFKHANASVNQNIKQEAPPLAKLPASEYCTTRIERDPLSSVLDFLLQCGRLYCAWFVGPIPVHQRGVVFCGKWIAGNRLLPCGRQCDIDSPVIGQRDRV